MTFCLGIENNVSLCFKLSSVLSMSNYWLHNTIILFSDWRDTCSCLSVNEWQVLSNSINWTNDGTCITTKSENTHKQVFLKECWRTIYSYFIFLLCCATIVDRRFRELGKVDCNNLMHKGTMMKAKASQCWQRELDVR